LIVKILLINELLIVKFSIKVMSLGTYYKGARPKLAGI